MVGGLFGYFIYRIIDKVFGKTSENLKGTLIIVAILTALVIVAMIII